MLDLKYSALHTLILFVCLFGCKQTQNHVSPFRQMSPTLHWNMSPTVTRDPDAPYAFRQAAAQGYLTYLKKLLGQPCTQEKWTELTRKALRKNGYRQHHRSLLKATERILIEDMNVGDLIFFHKRARVTSHAVVTARHSQSRFSAIATVNNRLVEVFVSPTYPRTRRRGPVLTNSFMRTIKANDPRPGYLAGELVREVRRPLIAEKALSGGSL